VDSNLRATDYESADDELGGRAAVVILYVGKRQPRHRKNGDVWDLLHDLFEIENPSAEHRKPPCCDGSEPRISSDELDTFLRALRRMQRGR